MFQTVLKLIEILLQLPKFWDYSCVPLCQDHFGEFKGTNDRHCCSVGEGKFFFFFFSELVSKFRS